MVIYPLNNTIHLLNNPGQLDKFSIVIIIKLQQLYLLLFMIVLNNLNCLSLHNSMQDDGAATVQN